jgi:hypothetical protein
VKVRRRRLRSGHDGSAGTGFSGDHRVSQLQDLCLSCWSMLAAYLRDLLMTHYEPVRKAAGISGSQLSHYFPDKESLVRAVITWRADTMIGPQRDPPLGNSTASTRCGHGPIPT